jgi:hypothetical protein
LPSLLKIIRSFQQVLSISPLKNHQPVGVKLMLPEAIVHKGDNHDNPANYSGSSGGYPLRHVLQPHQSQKQGAGSPVWY